MQRRTRRKAWLGLFAVLLACSQVVDFDRGQIADQGGGGSDGGSPGGMDASTDGAVVKPDGAPPADTGVIDAGPECTENVDCDPAELCCSGKCVGTSATAGCETCGVQCTVAADSCTGRLCTCGSSASCSGATPFCAPPSMGAANKCLECRGDNDCAMRSDGKKQCVEGACVQCDVADGNSGCANPNPICASSTCVGCDSAHPCAGGMSCVSGSCYGCNDSTNVGCDPDGTTPICEPAPPPQTGLFQCVGCTSDAQCNGNANGGQCVAGACERCDPTAGQNNAGCNANSGTPICDVGLKTCRACTNGDCASGTCSDSGPTIGRCVGCTLHTQCSGATPYCDSLDGTCKSCATAGGAATADGFCRDQSAAAPVCDASGRCVACNAARGGCSGMLDQCLIAAGAPQNNTCVDCLNSTGTGGCSAPNDRCNVATHTCIACDSGGGCATGEQCLEVPANPVMNQCVDCVDDDGCSGMLNRCAPNHTCVDCLVPADCGDGKDCTQDLCDGNVCSHRPLAAIDDGIDCTVDDCTGNGNITHVPTNSRCTDSDGRSCTVPTCTAMAPGTGCTEEPNHGPCMSTTDCFADFCLGASGAPVTGCSMESPCDGGTCNMGMCVP